MPRADTTTGPRPGSATTAVPRSRGSAPPAPPRCARPRSSATSAAGRSRPPRWPRPPRRSRCPRPRRRLPVPQPARRRATPPSTWPTASSPRAAPSRASASRSPSSSSTARASPSSPRAWIPKTCTRVMDGCFKHLLDAVHRFEGTVNQFTGDGIMALFGAPIAHEDHARAGGGGGPGHRAGGAAVRRHAAHPARRSTSRCASASTPGPSWSARSATTCAWTTRPRARR